MNKRLLPVLAMFLLATLSLPRALAQENDQDIDHDNDQNIELKSQVRDFPPDFHQYTRDAIPEDLAPAGKPALRPQPPGLEGVAPSVLIRDVVIANTDPNLKNTNHSPNSEPSIAINPTHPTEIDILAFTAGWGADAAIWHSTNEGSQWSLDLTIPAPPGLPQSGCPCDQAPDFGRSNRLSATFLDFNTTNGIDAFTGTTTDPTSAANWKWLISGGVAQRTDHFGVGNVDQPWLLVNRDPRNSTQDDVYVAYDNFSGHPDMRIAAAPGTDPPNFTIDGIAGFSQGAVNPGQRLAVDHRNGMVYSLFQQCPTTVANCNSLGADPKTIRWMLNRSLDGGRTWKLNGAPGGIQVAVTQSTQPAPKFGTVNALLGGVDHVAVDPNNSDVYVVFGNRDPSTHMNRLSIVRLTADRSGGLNVGKPHFVTAQVQAALPSVAVAQNTAGTIAVLYMIFNGIDRKAHLPVFTAMLATSQDHGVTFTQQSLESFLSPAADNGDQRQRILGDYQQLKAVGTTFFGVFPGNGVPFGRPFANIDPIFFRTTVAP